MKQLRIYSEIGKLGRRVSYSGYYVTFPRLRYGFDSRYPLMKNKDFLQSVEWRKFQESVGRKTFYVEQGNFSASIIEHKLPIAGSYFYVPRWPSARIFNFQFSISNQFSNFNDQISKQMQSLINLAKENKIGWIRIDLENEELLKVIKNSVSYKIAKAPHDMQPKEVFAIDITKTEEQLLKEMKSKTRYNIRLAEKKGVKIFNNAKYIKDFLRLNRIMAKRQGISTHPDEYYQKMFEIIPSDILKLYVAEYEGKIIAANIVSFYGETGTYLHGASDDKYKNVMAPFLLQWKQIQDSRVFGCKKYDFGGIKTEEGDNSWSGITRFKLGFSPNTAPTRFSGSYDIVINKKKYLLYLFLQKARTFFKF